MLKETPGNVSLLDGRALFTVDDVSRLASISRATVYRMIDDGELARVHLRGRALITAESLSRVLTGKAAPGGYHVRNAPLNTRAR